MPFVALEVALDVVRALQPLVAQLKQRDRELARQLKTAASSIVLNLREGRRRDGADRLHLWRVAAGSADEVAGALELAVAWRDLDGAEVAGAQALLDRLLGLTWGLTR